MAKVKLDEKLIKKKKILNTKVLLIIIYFIYK